MHDTQGMSKPNLINNVSVLKKCRNKFDCLIHEMLIIQDLKPTLNVQSDSIQAKLFTQSQGNKMAAIVFTHLYSNHDETVTLP